MGINKRRVFKNYKKNPHPAGESTSSGRPLKHVVVVVMDAMKEFATEPLEWALKNITSPDSIVTLVGVMPWLNIPLSSKTWHDVWPMDFDSLQDRAEWRSSSDSRYHKLQEAINLCNTYGVILKKEVIMGYPTPLVVLERITSLHANWAVLDRHQRKNKEFYAERNPCNTVMMKDNGEPEVINHAMFVEKGEESLNPSFISNARS